MHAKLFRRAWRHQLRHPQQSRKSWALTRRSRSLQLVADRAHTELDKCFFWRASTCAISLLLLTACGKLRRSVDPWQNRGYSSFTSLFLRLAKKRRGTTFCALSIANVRGNTSTRMSFIILALRLGRIEQSRSRLVFHQACEGPRRSHD